MKELIDHIITNCLTDPEKLFLITLVNNSKKEEEKESSAKEREEERHPNWDDMKLL